MKKTFLIFFPLFIFCMSVCAQNNWKKLVIPGDELLNRSTDTAYYYQTSSGDRVSLLKVHELLILTTGSGIFDYYKNYKDDQVVSPTIGYYDLNHKLISKQSITCDVFDNSPNEASCSTGLGDDNGRQLRLYLLNYEGYVRIVTHRYRQANFDITIPCFKNKIPRQSRQTKKVRKNTKRVYKKK